MSIALRKKINEKKTIYTLYLDIYSNGSRTKEYLKNLKILVTPRTPNDRENNKSILQLAEKIRLNRALELEGNDYDVTAKHKQNIDFTAFYNEFLRTYQKEDIRVQKAVYNKFFEFIKEADIKLTSSSQIDNSLCYDFKEYLSLKLNGESPQTYFSRFKGFLSYCTRKKVFKENPAKGLNIKNKFNTLRKNYLTTLEIQMLNETHSSNDEVKRAFLFSCYTGLRFVDIKLLKYKNIDFNNKKLIIKGQKKTDIPLTQTLHDFAFKQIGKQHEQDDLVFNLPSSNGTNKMLKQWAQNSGIQKHITFHCGRHSFATNLIVNNANPMAASSLMGLSSTKHIQVYVQIAEDIKRETINLLPNI